MSLRLAGPYLVFCGGSWFRDKRRAHLTFRDAIAPSYCFRFLGFRLLRRAS